MRVLAKPRKGTAAKAKRARRARIERLERDAKQAARVRDLWACRRCGRVWWDRGVQLEAAHLVDKGMGGDGGRFSCERKHFVTLCHGCHQGPRSVHSGHVRMVFNEALMGDGPVEFFDQEPARTNIAPGEEFS